MRKQLIALAAALSAGGALTASAAGAAGLPSTGKDIAYAVPVDGQGTYTETGLGSCSAQPDDQPAHGWAPTSTRTTCSSRSTGRCTCGCGRSTGSRSTSTAAGRTTRTPAARSPGWSCPGATTRSTATAT